MERLVVARRHGSPDLSPRAATQYHAALSRLPWADAHRRVVGAFDERGALLASVERLALTGVLDGTPARICLVGAIAEYEATDARPAGLLMTQVLEEAAREGVDLALMVGDHDVPMSDGAYRVPTSDVTLRVIESSRRGAPMVPVRSGDHGDFAAMAAMPPLGGDTGGLLVDRPADYLEFCVTRARLRAGLDREGARQVQFLVVEEGGRAAAYAIISIVGTTWLVEACGDCDPSGARVGAILQTLVATEPMERRPLIQAWWPSPVIPPQVAEVSARPSADALWVHPLVSSRAAAALDRGDIRLWRLDLP